ncbi:MAG: GNAT family N-acetyltransferase [Pseudomonadota bacterium]
MTVPIKSGGGFEWEVIEDEARFESLSSDWAELNSKQGPDGFFTRVESVRENWARHRNDPRTSLHVYVLRDGGKLIFGAPMIKTRGSLGTHKLQWLDSKTPLYDDVLVDPDADVKIVAERFAAHLKSSTLRRVLKINFVVEETALHRVLTTIGAPLRYLTDATFLDLSEFTSWDDYVAKMSSNRRQQLRRFARKIQKAGAGPVQRVEDPGTRRLAISTIFEKKRSWVKVDDERPEWIVPAEAEAWFQNIAKHEDGRNRCHVFRLASQTDWIASILCFERDGTLYLSKIAHNSAWDRFSPGSVLVQQVLQFAFERGLNSADLMIGRSNWKDRFVNRSRSVSNCRIRLLPLLR